MKFVCILLKGQNFAVHPLCNLINLAQADYVFSIHQLGHGEFSPSPVTNLKHQKQIFKNTDAVEIQQIHITG